MSKEEIKRLIMIGVEITKKNIYTERNYIAPARDIIINGIEDGNSEDICINWYVIETAVNEAVELEC